MRFRDRNLVWITQFHTWLPVLTIISGRFVPHIWNHPRLDHVQQTTMGAIFRTERWAVASPWWRPEKSMSSRSHPQPRAAKHSASKEFQPKSNSSNWWFSAILCTHSSPVFVQGSGSRALYARKSCENTLWKHESRICTLVLHQPEIWTSFKRRHYLTTSHRETTKKHVTTISGSVTQAPPHNWLRVESNHFWVPFGGT